MCAPWLVSYVASTAMVILSMVRQSTYDSTYCISESLERLDLSSFFAAYRAMKAMEALEPSYEHGFLTLPSPAIGTEASAMDLLGFIWSLLDSMHALSPFWLLPLALVFLIAVLLFAIFSFNNYAAFLEETISHHAKEIAELRQALGQQRSTPAMLHVTSAPNCTVSSPRTTLNIAPVVASFVRGSIPQAEPTGVAAIPIAARIRKATPRRGIKARIVDSSDEDAPTGFLAAPKAKDVPSAAISDTVTDTSARISPSSIVQDPPTDKENTDLGRSSPAIAAKGSTSSIDEKPAASVRESGPVSIAPKSSSAAKAPISSSNAEHIPKPVVSKPVISKPAVPKLVVSGPVSASSRPTGDNGAVSVSSVSPPKSNSSLEPVSLKPNINPQVTDGPALGTSTSTTISSPTSPHNSPSKGVPDATAGKKDEAQAKPKPGFSSQSPHSPVGGSVVGSSPSIWDPPSYPFPNLPLPPRSVHSAIEQKLANYKSQFPSHGEAPPWKTPKTLPTGESSPVAANPGPVPTPVPIATKPAPAPAAMGSVPASDSQEVGASSKPSELDPPSNLVPPSVSIATKPRAAPVSVPASPAPDCTEKSAPSSASANIVEPPKASQTSDVADLVPGSSKDDPQPSSQKSTSAPIDDKVISDGSTSTSKAPASSESPNLAKPAPACPSPATPSPAPLSGPTKPFSPGNASKDPAQMGSGNATPAEPKGTPPSRPNAPAPPTGPSSGPQLPDWLKITMAGYDPGAAIRAQYGGIAPKEPSKTKGDGQAPTKDEPPPPPLPPPPPFVQPVLLPKGKGGGKKR